MENNIEDLIREDFRKRKIQPNTNAFERLHTKLDKQTANKRKRKIRILAYAASLIGLVFILQSVFNNDTSINKQIITNVKIKDSTKVPIAIENTSIAVEQSQFNESIDELATTKERRKTIVVKEKNVLYSQEKSPSKTLEYKAVEKRLIAINPADIKSVAFNDTTKKLPLAVGVKAKEITNEELDTLLARANQSLTKINKNGIAINAQSMLYEIEVEINKPLPEKVLLTIKTGATAIKELIKPTNKENN